MRTALVHVLCARSQRDFRPVAVTARRPAQRATSILVEREALALGHVYVLYRGGRSCKVISASVHRERLELVRGRLSGKPSYGIERVPVLEAW